VEDLARGVNRVDGKRLGIELAEGFLLSRQLVDQWFDLLVRYTSGKSLRFRLFSLSFAIQ